MVWPTAGGRTTTERAIKACPDAQDETGRRAVGATSC
jgi:hypothetical protein